MPVCNPKFTLAVVGCGSFARHFVPLFMTHPNVSRVFVCDKIPARAEEYARTFGADIIPSFEEVLSRREVDAVAVFVQRHLHGPVVTAALRAGKHVYSAVPMASSAEECAEIVRLVRETGLTYMMGETCIYYPCAMFCRREYRRGTFGDFVYGESQYHHDLSHFSKDFLADRPASAVPPFFYPTHSTAMLLHALDERVVRVTALGWRDTMPDTPFRRSENPWGNEFSNEFSLMQLAGGGVARVNECRRIGYKAPSSYISAFYGTAGAYQFQNARHLVTRLTKEGVELTDVSEEVDPRAMTEHRGDADFLARVANHAWQWTDVSPIQEEEIARRGFSPAFAALPSGHMNSHRLLVDDFCTAVAAGTLPPVNAWIAARYTVPGLLAHESALRGGMPLDVPDFGAP